MSVLVVGISHRSAPIPVLERVALDADGVHKTLAAVLDTPHVSEAVVVSTCNRVEVYVVADRFHASVDDVSRLLGELAGARRDEVVPHLFVRYDEAAVAHIFAVAAGLDSMVVGERQVLSQVRQALQRAQQDGSVGPTLNQLFQQALRVGRRARAESGIDKLAPSVVSAALEQAEAALGTFADVAAVVIGAGDVGRLAAADLRGRGVANVTVVNRTAERGGRLAADCAGSTRPWAQLSEALAEADLVVSCTGAGGVVVSRLAVQHAVAHRRRNRPFTVVDLAVPRDVEPNVSTLAGVRLIDLGSLGAKATSGNGADLSAARAIVDAEVASFTAARSAAAVTPTVVALRSMASAVVDAELARLAARLPDLDPRTRAELASTVRRVADKLLHTPTVRIKQLADAPGALSYADALSDLFSLDPASVAALSQVQVAASEER